MISKISITALVATCLMVGCNASPCRVSSRTTQIPTSLTTKATSAATAVTTDTTENTALSTTELSSTEEIYTTILSVTALSSTEQLTITITNSASGTETFSIPEGLTTTIAEEPTSTVAESAIKSVESTATSDDSTTTQAATTTDPTSTTSAVEAPVDPTFIINAGLEDSSQSISPWALYFTNPGISVAVDTNVRKDGQNSALMNFAMEQTNHIRQRLQSISADVSYTMSAWIRPDSQCTTAYLICTYSGTGIGSRGVFTLDTAEANKWRKVSTTCSYTQDQFDEGDMYLYAGLQCGIDAQSYIDSVGFTLSPA